LFFSKLEEGFGGFQVPGDVAADESGQGKFFDGAGRFASATLCADVDPGEVLWVPVFQKSLPDCPEKNRATGVASHPATECDGTVRHPVGSLLCGNKFWIGNARRQVVEPSAVPSEASADDLGVNAEFFVSVHLEGGLIQFPKFWYSGF
jgi:hypothetical protein